MIFDIGYGLTAAGYLVLIFLLMVVRKAGLAKTLLLAATTITCLWSVAHISLVGWVTDISQYAQLDSVRLWIWTLFLGACLHKEFTSVWQMFSRPIPLIMMILPTLSVAISVFNPFSPSLQYLIFTLVTVQMLVVLEQVFRQAGEQKWAYKPLIIYLGALTTFDFFTYANAAMVNNLNWSFFAARGYIYLALLPFLILAIRRIQQWGIDIFVSREVVLHSTLLMLSGAYLMIMALLGYMVKYFGGQWGVPIQIVLFLISIVLLASLFLSNEFRTKLKVFITKNFYANQFDYRVEWLALTKTLSAENKSLADIYHTALVGWVQGIKYEQGLLFKLENNLTSCVASIGNVQASELEIIESYSHHLRTYFTKKDWIIDFDEMRIKPEMYADIDNRNNMIANYPFHFMIPVYNNNSLWGMVCVNTKTADKHTLNWEIRDYLLAVTEQTAHFIFQAESNQTLSENAKFAAFNRMSAFVVHDLKNVLAQINLLLANAKQHKSNPEFIDDTFETLEHTKARMDNMLKQLMDKSIDQNTNTEAVNVSQLIESVIESKCQGLLPIPQFTGEKNVMVSIDAEKFANVLYHLINNAQQATDNNGDISIDATQQSHQIMINIIDNGEGMSQSFIEERLFTPFETTKGNAGMGVGAYDAKNFLQSIGGNLVVKSELGKGSCFTLYIPDAKDEEDK
ncbi:XrtA/PEP-CTERM system histidine kinase PrsK [Glaciecola sp. 2405UD65-10]|uniref:XrtA/PEP-CTERM system histidine kinase PrsK n=1 Tax=Glaciecola sp. 2405UD65-10 TaxID=3397244 RepID=UPI003B59DBA0